MTEIRVLELFSGIGGMHCAVRRSQLGDKIQISAAIDINENANRTYAHNFPQHKCLNKNITKLNIKEFQKINCILMSPPCQPFTRNGNFKDTEDRRTDAFQHICDIIKAQSLPELSYILMENVVGFDKSTMRDIYIETLEQAGFHYQEFIISPTSVGVANTRHRYYCIARKSKEFTFKSDEILTNLPNFTEKPSIPPISTYLDTEAQLDQLKLPENVLEKRFQVLDICTLDSTNSMCFTKSYTRYIEGTGSVFCSLTRAELDEKLQEIETHSDNMHLRRSLALRFFSSREVLRLMSFPEDFNFPPSVSEKQQYKLLGNSINVAVVGELIKLLFNELT